MRKVIYVVNGIEVTSFTEKVELENKFNTKAEIVLREVKESTPTLPPIRKAMLEQFGFVSAKLKNKVVLQ